MTLKWTEMQTRFQILWVTLPSQKESIKTSDSGGAVGLGFVFFSDVKGRRAAGGFLHTRPLSAQKSAETSNSDTSRPSPRPFPRDLETLFYSSSLPLLPPRARLTRLRLGRKPDGLTGLTTTQPGPVWNPAAGFFWVEALDSARPASGLITTWPGWSWLACSRRPHPAEVQQPASRHALESTDGSINSLKHFCFNILKLVNCRRGVGQVFSLATPSHPPS